MLSADMMLVYFIHFTAIILFKCNRINIQIFTTIVFFWSEFSYRTRLVSAANHAQSNLQSVADFGDFCVFRYRLPERRLFAVLVNKYNNNSRSGTSVQQQVN